jgi:hypothetical protein
MQKKQNRVVGVCGNRTVNTHVPILHTGLPSSETRGHHMLNAVHQYNL